MKKLALWGAVAASVVMLPSAAYAEKKPQMTSLQMQQMQSRDLEADKDTAFSAVMTVLQDSGYRIEGADKDTGIITGIGSSKGKLTWAPFVGFGKSKKTPIVSAYIETYGPMTRVRLNFVLAKVKSSLYGSQPQDEEPILDAQVYSDAFERINADVFLRQSLSAKAVKPQPAPVSEVSVPAVVEEVAATPVAAASVTPAVTCTTCQK